MMLRTTLDFLLYDWLKSDALCQRPRFADHSRETFDAVLSMCERIAREKFAPFNRLSDVEEPRFDGERVHLPRATHDALTAYAQSGMLAAAQDADVGGMQLPCTLEMAANAFFSAASVSMSGYAMLTSGNANLLMAHGTHRQKTVFAAREFAGRWFGTMCLSEPQAGSSLSDVATRARSDGDAFERDPLGPRYRLRGNKMWISGGEHEITENIVHLVLAKVEDAQGRVIDGVKGLSLFIVPKWMVSPEGELTGERNDVALAGLNHKLGYRGTTNTLLNFGEGKYAVRSPTLGTSVADATAGAVGYLVGRPGDGLRCMFHMMNEARIGVGLGAVMLGYAGYEASLTYARDRAQGRPVGPQGKNAASPQVPIVEHADVKRMLLAQKAYVEGALALSLYCARLVDEQQTGAPEAARDAGLLLDVLTPIAKSWPSQWCLEANSLAIQVHGGYGYTRDFAVEQHWRDNRLNMIHEGTHGIQAMDLLGRKVLMHDGAGLALLGGRVAATALQARIADTARQGYLAPTFTAMADALERALTALTDATRRVWSSGDPQKALANATPYLEAFGHTVIAWIWLDVASTALALAPSDGVRGKIAAARYFYAHELPKVQAWLAPVSALDETCASMQDAWF